METFHLLNFRAISSPVLNCQETAKLRNREWTSICNWRYFNLPSTLFISVSQTFAYIKENVFSFCIEILAGMINSVFMKSRPLSRTLKEFLTIDFSHLDISEWLFLIEDFRLQSCLSEEKKGFQF